MAKLMVSGLAALAALLLAGAASAQAPAQPAKPPAEPWVYLHFSDGAMAWNLNAGRWGQNNNIAEGERLLWFAKPVVQDGVAIVWARDFWRIDCAANTLQIKSGEELGPGLHWPPITPASRSRSRRAPPTASSRSSIATTTRLRAPGTSMDSSK